MGTLGPKLASAARAPGTGDTRAKQLWRSYSPEQRRRLKLKLGFRQNRLGGGGPPPGFNQRTLRRELGRITKPDSRS